MHSNSLQICLFVQRGQIQLSTFHHQRIVRYNGTLKHPSVFCETCSLCSAMRAQSPPVLLLLTMTDDILNCCLLHDMRDTLAVAICMHRTFLNEWIPFNWSPPPPRLSCVATGETRDKFISTTPVAKLDSFFFYYTPFTHISHRFLLHTNNKYVYMSLQ